jgi:hypothetical protein
MLVYGYDLETTGFSLFEDKIIRHSIHMTTELSHSILSGSTNRNENFSSTS